MRLRITHGAEIDALTPDELQAVAASMSGELPQRVRAVTTFPLDANGNGIGEIYTVPAGLAFELRRVFIDPQIPDPNVGFISMAAAGKFVEYLRSGTRIEYGLPIGPSATAPRIPGTQTWGAEQGPFFVNGEVFEVRITGAVGVPVLTVFASGILERTTGAQGEI